MNHVLSLTTPTPPSHPAKAPNKRFKRSLAIGLLLTIASFCIWWFWDSPLVTPLSQTPVFRFLTGEEPQSSEGKVIYGFLPYWNLTSVELHPELTHLAYFGLTIGSDGQIVTREEDYQEPGYSRLQSERFLELSQTHLDNGGQVEIVLAQFNNDAIVALLNSPAAHQRLLSSIDSLLLAYPVKGINIDIEYSGTVTPQLQKNYTALIRTLHNHLRSKYAGVKLSIDVYASAARNTQLWQINELGQYVDYIVIMAYDFHRRSSPTAGPVAPLFGGKQLWDSDINQHLQEFVAQVPPEKLLLGVPFYGYEWQTLSGDAQAQTLPETGATASYKRVQEILAKKDELKVKEHWNESALSPYLSYQEDGKTYIIYYENSRSLSYKLDYVNQLGLGGMAIWALGYEGSSRELWM